MLLSAEGIEFLLDFFVLGRTCFQVVTDQYRNYAAVGASLPQNNSEDEAGISTELLKSLIKSAVFPE